MRLEPDAGQGWVLHGAVEDTGIGIPPDRLERLFQPFTQVDASTTRQFGGTGLGLTICARLCEMMGGHIGVHSVEGQGTTFHFSVRLLAGQAPVVPQAEHRPDAEPLQGLRVLVAEDNPVNQQLMRSLLARLGCETTLVDNGREALAEVRRAAFDVVLMDLQMPEMDGIEATRAIRASALAQQPHIIALTANSYDSDRDNCRQAGMDDFIGKPFRLPELQEKLAQVPRRGRA